MRVLVSPRAYHHLGAGPGPRIFFFKCKAPEPRSVTKNKFLGAHEAHKPTGHHCLCVHTVGGLLRDYIMPPMPPMPPIPPIPPMPPAGAALGGSGISVMTA